MRSCIRICKPGLIADTEVPLRITARYLTVRNISAAQSSLTSLRSAGRRALTRLLIPELSLLSESFSRKLQKLEPEAGKRIDFHLTSKVEGARLARATA